MKNLYVGNLPYGTTKEELYTLFKPYGTVERVTIPRDMATGEARGFAFVEMQDENAAAEAMRALNGSRLGNRALLVNKAHPRPGRTELRGHHKRGFGGS